MKKSVELRKKIDTLKNTIRVLKDEGKIEDAHGKLDELKGLRNELAIAEALEQEEMEEFAGSEIETVDVENVDANRVFNKLVFNRPLTEAEREYSIKNAPGTPGQVEHTDEKGGYLVPEENLTALYEYRRKYSELKNLCNVIPVKTLKGSRPMEVEATEYLTNFEELNEIAQSDINFAQMKWEVKDMGDIIPVSNTLLDDIDMNLIEYIGKRFAKKSINTENRDILTVLKTFKKVAGKKWNDIVTTLNVTLNPAISANAVILTNQSGFDWLDNLVDGNDRPLLNESLQDPTQKVFKGRPVIAVEDELLASTGTKHPFFVGDIEEGVVFFDRKGVEVALSEHAGFTKNATLLRAIERYDVKKLDEKAVVYLEIDTAVAAG